MSEVTLPGPVPATYCKDIDEVKAKPGAFEFYQHGDRYPAGMIYCCPCGCGRLGSLQFRPAPREEKASWEWNGSTDKPTLSPSVHHVGHWHGWLRDGQWVQA